jgi:hypothetical protein
MVDGLRDETQQRVKVDGGPCLALHVLHVRLSRRETERSQHGPKLRALRAQDHAGSAGGGRGGGGSPVSDRLGEATRRLRLPSGGARLSWPPQGTLSAH